ncbi:MAG: OsmC family protein [candidate division WOR-3 bacterium]
MQHEATVRWCGRMTFVGKAGSNHLVPMDVDADTGGDSSATKPLELLLLGLGGCTGMDVVSILNKMRVTLSGFEVNLRAERAAEHPKVYTRIEIEYVFSGHDLDPEKLKRAVELSQEKYCSVSAMLRQACPVTWTIRVVQA